MTYKYYVCSQCGEFFQRIELENGYIHPCTKCNSPKLIEIPIDYRQYKRMIRKGTWDDFVKKAIEPYQGNPDYIGRPVKDYSSEYMERKRQDELAKKEKLLKCAPKCPTCGCAEVRKITDAEKAKNAFWFGMFGNIRKYQFECLNPNTKYKW